MDILKNRFVRFCPEFFPRYAYRSIVLIVLAVVAALTGFAQAPNPAEVSSQGYINTTPLTTHTTAPFNTVGATTLVAFVGSHNPWNGQSVSITGITDNMGNTWQLLTGPTAWNGNTYPLLGAVYYVNVPTTSSAHTVTVSLTNPAPLVVHIFAVSGSNVSARPIYSAITNPGSGGTSSLVTTAPITVPSGTLLLSWAKNELTDTATAIDGYTLDPNSVGFLWAESETAVSAGSYTGDFQFNTPTGWQTAVVGVEPAGGPEALNQSVTANYNTAANITLQAISPSGFPLTYSVVSNPAHGTLSGTAPNLTYTPASGYSGADSFTFKANDGTGDSNIATVSVTVRGPNHPPVASNVNVTATAGTPTAVNLVATDADGDALTYAIVSQPAHGQISGGTGPNRTYTPTTGFVGNDSFTFKANDGMADSNIATVSITVTEAVQAPTEIGSRGYINGTALTTHTTASFNTVGASTLVAFLSTDSPWNGQPVSISGISDNMGNTWQVLTGPTAWTGSSYGQLSAIYYVNVPATSSTHTVTVKLTNPAPFVMHIFAVSGSDITGPPIYSAITNPGTGGASATVTTAPISVGAGTLLLGWVKNETTATATAIDGYSLDANSTSFLWAESETAGNTGSYTGDFQYNTSIGWQAAVVGMKPAGGPEALSQSVTTNYNTAANITLQAVSPSGFPLTYSVVSGPTNGKLSGTAPNLTYTPNSNYSGNDSFTFKANDGTGDSNIATVSITVRSQNLPPVASNGNVTVTAGSPAAVSLVATDPNGNPLTYLIVSQPAHGQISAGTGPSRIYTPNTGFVGSDSFTFKANDGTLDSNIATVTITVTAAAQVPTEIGSQGYINGTPLTTHTTAAFNTIGASTLVAFVSTNTPWNGQPVSISGVSDNMGNTWQVLTGPTLWTGSSTPLISAIYYVNIPATSSTHTVTVQLTNPAPLVMHVFAVSGSNVTGPPIYSAITDPGSAGVSAGVTTAPITVPTGTLLLSWVKNASGATATAIDGYTLDAGSTSYLWAESQPAVNAGSYTGDFQYDSAIGWQTAVVGIKPVGGPEALNQSVTTNSNTPVSITLEAISPSGFPLTYSVVSGPANGTLSGTAPNLTYTPNSGYAGKDSFTFKANDGTGDSNIATVSITVAATQQVPVEIASRGYINGTALTTHTTASFNTMGASTLVAFVSTNSPWNGTPISITGVSDNLGNTWQALTGPTQWNGNQYGLLSGVYYVNVPATSKTHTVTVQLSNAAPLVVHVFAVSGSDISGPPIFSAITNPGTGGTAASVTTTPITVPTGTLLLSWAKNETTGTATVGNGFTLDSGSTSFLWAESEAAVGAGSYSGAFQYSSAIGWQAAVVGLKPAGTPEALSQAVTVNFDTSTSVILQATSPEGAPLTYSVVSEPADGTLAGAAPNLTYIPNTGYSGNDAFTFKANDGSGDSNVATVNITVTSSVQVPTGIGSQGYINGTALTTHTTAAFNTAGATTLVAFVGTNSPWNSAPVSIGNVSDNMGNNWQLLTGPASWTGDVYPLTSAIYYVNAPVTSGSLTVTVQLSNPAPLVMHIFAVSGSDITSAPIYSAITNPGTGGSSASVTTAPITVPAGSLLLSWAKNETSASATAVDGYTLDPNSTSFLWAESETATTAGSYTGDFQYSSSIGWQTAVVGLKPAGVTH